MEVAASKSRDMDVTSFAVAGIEKVMTEHLENVGFVIRRELSCYAHSDIYKNIKSCDI